ncbi:MAG TPA: HPr(Ser) kinase/phosphatase [Kofleriaceae bacterium]
MADTAVLTVSELLERSELEITAVAGRAGLARTITVPRIQKPGLALTGWPEQLHANRVLVLGGTDIEYLEANEQARTVGVETLFASEPACVVVCRGRHGPDELRMHADARGVPLLTTALPTAEFIVTVTSWMTDRLSPTLELHGVLMDVNGIGVLMLGQSGIGKSETALDLVVRGHRLVADDIVRVRQKGGAVVGRGAGILGHHMEIRGLGIINIEDLYGVAAVRNAKMIELVVELHEWEKDSGDAYDRLGFDDNIETILGVNIPKVRVPVRPGRNLATLTEVAARNQLLKLQGTHSARAFRDQLHHAMASEAGMDTAE